MKNGTTTIAERADKRFPPTVLVGNDDRIVRVSFGTMQIVLSNLGDANVIIARAEAYDQQHHPLPVSTRGSSDIKNQIEFHLVAAPHAA